MEICGENWNLKKGGPEDVIILGESHFSSQEKFYARILWRRLQIVKPRIKLTPSCGTLDQLFILI